MVQIKKLVPKGLLDAYRRNKRKRIGAINEARSTEDVFSEIYQKNVWGGEKGDFCSGGGTVVEEIASPYLQCVQKLGQELGFAEMSAVDLGCGDMRIGQEVRKFFGSYTGVDIVKPLIESHRQKFEDEKTKFLHLNMVEEELPKGDVCMIRQVFQHLSNQQISTILPKLSQFRYILITEHLPTPGPKVMKNLDKCQGGSIRLYENSGVFLTEPPFSVAKESVRTVLEVPSHEIEDHEDNGIIQTVLISNFQEASS